MMDSVHDCSLPEVARWMGLQDGCVLEARLPGDRLATRRVRAGEVLVHEQQVLDHFLVVGAGSLKLFNVDEDGFEQVTAFALRGDVVGLDGCSTGRHPVTAIALTDTTVVMLARWAALRGGASDSVIPRLLQHAAAAELQRRTDTQHLMAPANAEVRVARFLIHFGRRQAQQGFSAKRFRLPMSRRDIASFLGLAHETVSRSMSLLQSSGCVVAQWRDVEVVDAALLARLAQATRGPSARSGLKRFAHERTACTA